MLRDMRVKKLFSSWTAWGLVLALALLGTACGPAPTPTPSPTPTPTPLPAFHITPDSTGGDVFSQLPLGEQQCLRASLSSEHLDALLEVTSGDGPSFLGAAEEVSGCVGDESRLRATLGFLDWQVGGLDPSSVTCLRSVFSSFDTSQLASAGSSESPVGIAAAMGLMLCLTEQEAAKVAIGPSGDGDVAMHLTLADVRCLAQLVDPDLLADLLAAPSLEGPTDPEMLTALEECGVQMDGAP